MPRFSTKKRGQKKYLYALNSLQRRKFYKKKGPPYSSENPSRKNGSHNGFFSVEYCGLLYVVQSSAFAILIRTIKTVEIMVGLEQQQQQPIKMRGLVFHPSINSEGRDTRQPWGSHGTIQNQTTDDWRGIFFGWFSGRLIGPLVVEGRKGLVFLCVPVWVEEEKNPLLYTRILLLLLYSLGRKISKKKREFFSEVGFWFWLKTNFFSSIKKEDFFLCSVFVDDHYPV